MELVAKQTIFGNRRLPNLQFGARHAFVSSHVPTHRVFGSSYHQTHFNATNNWRHDPPAVERFSHIFSASRMPSEAPLSATDSATADQKVLEAFKVLPKLEMETPEEGWPAPVEIDSNQMGDSNVGGRFFSRLHEYTAISNYVKSRPEQPVLILGPRNSGKTVRTYNNNIKKMLLCSH